jgi:hypothetical protein
MASRSDSLRSPSALDLKLLAEPLWVRGGRDFGVEWLGVRLA